MEEQSLNHWTTREFPVKLLLIEGVARHETQLSTWPGSLYPRLGVRTWILVPVQPPARPEDKPFPVLLVCKKERHKNSTSPWPVLSLSKGFEAPYHLA